MLSFEVVVMNVLQRQHRIILFVGFLLITVLVLGPFPTRLAPTLQSVAADENVRPRQ